MKRTGLFTRILAIALMACSGLAAADANPAATPVQQGGTQARHAQKVAAVAKERFDLLLIGDSITHTVGDYGGNYAGLKVVWDRFFAPRHALNLGYSGARTENILWNLMNGELEGQSPRVVTLMLGTNNADRDHYPTHHTAEQIAGGIEAIVKVLRGKLPDTKILLLRCFPYGANPSDPANLRNRVLDDVSWRISRLADGRHIFFWDVNHVFLNPDGTMNKSLMPDVLHPNTAGAMRWAQALEPMLCELMGDASRDTPAPTNTAVIPTPKLENDSYDWHARHRDVLKARDTMRPDVIMIGDSITHFWGGEPKSAHVRGPQAWKTLFGDRQVLNMGFGWDRTQNVLWRLDHGEMDGLQPRVVVLHIGTNNTSGTPNARQNTPDEIAEGIREIIVRVRSKAPGARIVLMAVFPREQRPDHPRRLLINEINNRIREFGSIPGVTWLDIGPKMLQPDGTLSREIMSDFCHPTEKGYAIWAEALAPLLPTVEKNAP